MKKSQVALPQILGGISTQQFLDEYWQQKPLLIRNAFVPSFAPLTNPEILTLAGYEDAESRLVLWHNKAWSLDHGPFGAKDFKQLRSVKDARWTVLVQDVQHFSFEAHALLKQFNFLPQTRIDDLMVSYAVKGAGVGPHFDTYDVFLLQGSGQRRWQISAQDDLTLQDDVPLKILKHFKPTQDWVLNAGDMLYLPPSYAHNGIAETDDCVTWSIGFRAPSNQEMLEAWLDEARDTLKADGRYTDAKRQATTEANHASIDALLSDYYRNAVTSAVMQPLSADSMRQFIGRTLTAPKPHVAFAPPEKLLARTAFRKKIQAVGVSLDLRTRMLYDEHDFYINGQLLDGKISKADRATMIMLSNQRKFEASVAKFLSDKAFEAIYAEYTRGYLTF